MTERIIEKKIKNRYYYYYRKSHRVKVEPSQGEGKTKGSGKSRVINEDIYLGTAEVILAKIKGT